MGSCCINDCLLEDVTIDRRAGDAATGRRFFVSSKQYIGLAPREAKVGDVIAVVMGGEVPLVLRRINHENEGGSIRWNLVGECYVHGIMDGEAMRADGEIEDIIIE